MSDAPGLLSLYNLLARASNVSCSKGASAFLSLPATEDDRLSLVIDGFLPALRNSDLQIPQRILAAFVLNALYASHDHLNPFNDHLLQIFESERAIAIAPSQIKPSPIGPSHRTLESPQIRNAENEQFVWVLWKILQGEANDLAPYSPNVLSRTTIPEHLRPLHLDTRDSSRYGNGTYFNPHRSPTEVSQPSLGFMDPPASQNSTPLFQTGNPLAISGPPRTSPASSFLSNRTPYNSEVSPFDIAFPESNGVYHQKASEGEESQMNESLRQTVSKEAFTGDIRYQHSLEVQYGYISSPGFTDPIHEPQADINGIPQISRDQHSKVIDDQRQRVSLPTRSPGVIGSGRPSASISKNNAPVNPNTFESRWSQIGILGNGRPASVRDGTLANRGTDPRREHERMIPFSVLRMRSMKEESEKGEGGIIGQPEPGLGDDNGRKSTWQTDRQTSLLEKLTALSMERRAQEPSQAAEIASFNPQIQAFDRNLPPSQDKTKSVLIHPPSATLQLQAIPLQPSAITFHPQPVGIPASAADQNITEQAASPRHLYQISEKPQSSFYSSRPEETSATHINEKERDELSHAIFLLLSARERVLTLAEQRMLQPHLSTLTQPLSLLRPSDIPPLVTKNTDLAAKLLLFLLDRDNEEAQRIERIVRDGSKDGLFHMNHGSSDDGIPLPTTASIDSMPAVDAIQAMVRFVSTCGAPSNSVGSNDLSPFGGREAKDGYLDAIRKLPPTMQSFNLIAKLLRPRHYGGVRSEQQGDTPEVRVEILVRTEVLGGFVSGCVRWIEHAEQEEKEGEVHDDRVAIAITSLCRFYSSLLKHGFVSAASEVDTTEMMGFALRFSRFEEARSLYSTLAAART